MVTIMNIGRVPLQVGLFNPATGERTTTRIMGRGRGNPQEGWVVDPNWMALYGKSIKLVETSPVVKAQPAAVKTSSSNVRARMEAAKQASIITAPTVEPTGA